MDKEKSWRFHTGLPSLHVSIFLLLVPSLIVCAQKQKVREEVYGDGTPKRDCIYKGTGEKRILLQETTYYPNKQVQQTGTYRNGRRHGRWIYYYENGKVWSEGFFKEGKSHGKRLTYFEDGKLRYEAWYKNDQRTGTWKFYDRNGTLIKEVDYTRQKVLKKNDSGT